MEEGSTSGILSGDSEGFMSSSSSSVNS